MVNVSVSSPASKVDSISRSSALASTLSSYLANFAASNMKAKTDVMNLIASCSLVGLHCLQMTNPPESIRFSQAQMFVAFA